MQKTLLTNTEYTILQEIGGDSLIAVFATIRNSKNQEVIKKVGKKGLCATLKSVTGLSRTTLNNHLPHLLQLGIIEVHANGNVAVHSRKWSSNNLYRSCNKEKLIPIIIGKKFTDTRTNVFFVRVHSNIKSQEKQIIKKAERIELLSQHERGKDRSVKNLKRAKKLVNKGFTSTSLKTSYRSNSTISNTSFNRLRNGSESKHCGNYHKTKLLKKGLINQTRNVGLFLEGVFSYSYLYDLRDNYGYGGFFIGNKGIYFEDSPSIRLS